MFDRLKSALDIVFKSLGIILMTLVLLFSASMIYSFIEVTNIMNNHAINK